MEDIRERRYRRSRDDDARAAAEAAVRPAIAEQRVRTVQRAELWLDVSVELHDRRALDDDRIRVRRSGDEKERGREPAPHG